MNRQFLEEQAQKHNLTDEQKNVFMETVICYSPQENVEQSHQRVAKKLSKSSKRIRDILTGIYSAFELDNIKRGKLDKLINLLGEEYKKNYREEPGYSSRSFEEILQKWKGGKKIIYSAPAATFFAGEHAVVFGHPAIYYPLPMRLFVHIEPDKYRSEIYWNEYKAPDPNNINNIDSVVNIKDYGHCGVPDQTEALNKLFKSIIRPFLQEKTGFKISVLSSFPIAVGLNSSGAFSVCLAKGLVDNFLDIAKFKNYFDIKEANTDRIVLILAWAIGNCFHNFSSSGVGIHGSFYGRQGKHPIFYCCSKRSNLVHRIASGYKPVNLGEGEKGIKNILSMKTLTFDPAIPITYSTENINNPNIPINLSPYPSPPNYNITVLYSGIHSKTESVLADFNGIRRFVPGSIERVNYVYEQFKAAFPDYGIQKSIDIHSEILKNIYLNPYLEDKDKQLKCAYKELMTEALGNLSIGMLNSLLSDWKLIPELMNTCQCLLFNGGISASEIDAFVIQLQAQAMQHQLNNKETVMKIGAKLTGAGKGGDIIVLSLYEPDVHKDLIERVTKHNYTTHFSCFVSPDMKNIRVEGVKAESP
ncbi:MAG: hypothetical protein F6K22_28295 [Okeania sp. SIO2F4]|uniref:mevalonate kinase family protein n=1 Tax=Okeania sp. SIO2F4 TaxID=2607790 RepID=UPI00142A181A|nr:hypothetical protein [Okeania sp. SIO2F4]NES06375.1 hypothetical protein [Okeania sp. SIO2F4]